MQDGVLMIYRQPFNGDLQTTVSCTSSSNTAAASTGHAPSNMF